MKAAQITVAAFANHCLAMPTANVSVLCATRRLMKDYCEVLRNPLPNVVAGPLEDDIFRWCAPKTPSIPSTCCCLCVPRGRSIGLVCSRSHAPCHAYYKTATERFTRCVCRHCNVRQAEGDGGAFDGCSFHIELLFDSSYPSSMPKISLFTPVPHPNLRRPDGGIVVRTPSGREYGSGWRLELWDCIPTWKGWTSAYTVQSILVQLQAFLLAEDLMMADQTKVTTLTARDMAVDFSCQCGHTNAAPRPQFWTQQELQATQPRVVQVVGRPVHARPPCQLPKPRPSAAPSVGRVRPVKPPAAPTTTSAVDAIVDRLAQSWPPSPSRGLRERGRGAARRRRDRRAAAAVAARQVEAPLGRRRTGRCSRGGGGGRRRPSPSVERRLA